MSTPAPAGRPDLAATSALRRRLIALAATAAVLSLLHFADHVIRGELVVAGGLDPAWNHSGWPFNTHSDKPYIFPISFVVVFGLLLGGIYYTLKGRLWAGYWLATSIGITALLIFVHFIGASPGAAETPTVIAMSHHHAAFKILALFDLVAVFIIYAALAAQAIKTRQQTGRW